MIPAFSDSGALYLAGAFRDTVDFGTGPLTSGSLNGYVAEVAP